jgi:hypothetical protein
MAALRDRINSRRRGEKLGLTYRERAALWKMGIIRPGRDVVAMYKQVKAEHLEMRMTSISTEMGKGILAAIEWCTGVTPTAPISGQLAEENPPSTPQMSGEEEAASEVAEGRRAHARSRHFAVGVEHTIMWLLARTDQRPWGKLYDH